MVNFTLRLQVDTVAALNERAKREHLPVRTMVRKWIMDKLDEKSASKLTCCAATKKDLVTGLAGEHPVKARTCECGKIWFIENGVVKCSAGTSIDNEEDLL